MSFIEGLAIIAFIFVVMTICLVIQRSFFYDGKIIVKKDKETGNVTYSLEVNVDPYEIEHMKHVSFKVVKENEVAN